MNKELIVNGISNDILKDLTVDKIANEILSPMEKEAASGVAAFGKALLGTDKRMLSAQRGRIAEELIKKSKNPKIQEARALVSKAEDLAANADLHPRMDSVKENYKNALKKYQDIASKKDHRLNAYVGSKAPLKLVDPRYSWAKLRVGLANTSLKDAEKQYVVQRKRISKDIMKEVDLAKQNAKDLEKKHDISKLQDELKSVNSLYDHAATKTRNARIVTGVGAAAGVGAYKFHKAKKNKENEVGPYMYSNAGETPDLIEKIATEILGGIVIE